MAALGFADAAVTGRPGYHPAMLLKLYIYGYLNQVQSSRRLEREAGRNVELLLTTATERVRRRTDRVIDRRNGQMVEERPRPEPD